MQIRLKIHEHWINLRKPCRILAEANILGRGHQGGNSTPCCQKCQNPQKEAVSDLSLHFWPFSPPTCPNPVTMPTLVLILVCIFSGVICLWPVQSVRPWADKHQPFRRSMWDLCFYQASLLREPSGSAGVFFNTGVIRGMQKFVEAGKCWVCGASHHQHPAGWGLGQEWGFFYVVILIQPWDLRSHRICGRG